MLKMAGTGHNGLKVIVLGLSESNIKLLKEDKPITFDGADVGLDNARFIIFAGENEREMARKLAKLIGPKTEVRIDPRFKD